MKIFQSAKHSLFLFHKKIMEEKKGTAFFSIFIILWALSVFWRLTAAIRWRFSKLKPFKARATVISIGNIVAGGTGKTPLVIKLIEELLVCRDKIGIVSRGYGARQSKIPNQISANTHWQLIGDEPKCILNVFNDVALFVGKNRKSSAKKAIENGKALLILDDGMQQKKLHCDINIVAVNANDPFGKGKFLPLGYLKDHPKRLAYADLIVINHCSLRKEYEVAKNKIRSFSSAPTVGIKTVFKKALDSSGNKISLIGQKIGAFCSIANPKNFIKLLDCLRCDVIYSKFYNDHAEISKKSLLLFDNKCCQKNARYLVCTDKDFVKIRHLKTNLPIVVVKIDLELCFEKSNWDKLVERIQLSCV